MFFAFFWHVGPNILKQLHSSESELPCVTLITLEFFLVPHSLPAIVKGNTSAFAMVLVATCFPGHNVVLLPGKQHAIEPINT